MVHASSLYGPCVITVRSVRHHCTVGASSVYGRCVISVRSVLHQRTVRVSSAYGPCVISVRSMRHQCMVHVSSVYIYGPCVITVRSVRHHCTVGASSVYGLCVMRVRSVRHQHTVRVSSVYGPCVISLRSVRHHCTVRASSLYGRCVISVRSVRHQSTLPASRSSVSSWRLSALTDQAEGAAHTICVIAPSDLQRRREDRAAPGRQSGARRVERGQSRAGFRETRLSQKSSRVESADYREKSGIDRNTKPNATCLFVFAGSSETQRVYRRAVSSA
ncbi:unnamed protein product, partial [Ranitomeya imitator]